MKKSSAFCPAYVTGLFTIAKGDAAGSGFAIDLGMKTTVSEVKEGGTKILLNGKLGPAPVSQSVMAKWGARAGRLGTVLVEHEAGVPIGYGLSMSAAGALSLSLALNDLLGAGLPREECVKIAHDADVECGTGLSGVDAAAEGGMLARRSMGEAPVKLPFEEREIDLAFYSPLRTSDVIRSDGWKEKVNAAGENALRALFAERSWDGFVSASRQFASETGLAAWCGREMAQNRRASMAMLGRTLFSDELLVLLARPLSQLQAKTHEEGAGLV